MKKRILRLKIAVKVVMIALLLGVVGKMYAYDFSAVCETGQTLYYNITDVENHFVELTYPGTSINSTWSGYTKPTGNIVLPNQVEYNGSVYSVKSIGERAFYYCNGLTGSLIIPNSIISIASFAFLGCTGLDGSLTLNNGLTSVGGGAFNGCKGFIGDLIIPNTVTIIDGNAFSGCSGFSGSLIIGNSVITIGHGAFYGCSGFVGDLVIPNSVTYIGNNYEYPGTFQNCSGFNGTLTLSNSISIIGRSAFSGCNGFIGQLNIPNTVTIIGDESFFECNGFTGQLVIPNTVTYIGEGAFYNCSGFDRNLSIPSSVTIINRTDIGSEIKNPFYGTAWYNSQNDGVLYLDGWCLGYKGDINPVVTIPEGIIHVAGGAFLNCSSITSVSIPNSVTDIGQSAFEMCENLTSVSLSNSLTSISWGTFAYCVNLNSIILPNSITTIGDHAFRGCGFSTITIPNSVTVIENYAFQNDNLCSVILGNSVVSIGESAFETPDVLRTVVSLSETPPLLGNFAFVINPEYYGVSGTVSIYVPYESLDAYQNASGWNEFESSIYPMAYNSIPGYGEGNSNWQFIASPLAENIAPTEIEDMIPPTGTYDLYRFDQTESAEWQNYKENNFTLTNGQGYLYANAENVNIIFKGEFNEEETKEVGLAYDANAEFAGWNLVGNPFPISAYANRSYYVMNEEGTAIEPVAVSMETAIPVCTGVMVKADAAGETVTFSKTAPDVAVNQGVLQIAVANANQRGASTGSATALDKAIVSFNAGDALEKFVFNKDNAKLYISQSDKDLAIACTDKQGEMPLNFKATKNGEYTITIHPEVVELDYLHLVDNLTGVDVDLLVTPAYTFTAKTTDYASRFKLVFSVCGDMDDDNENFAFVTNKDIIITGEGIAQVIDMRGRVIVSVDEGTRCITTVGMTPGVYVLRLLDGNDVKTQKIVIQ